MEKKAFLQHSIKYNVHTNTLRMEMVNSNGSDDKNYPGNRNGGMGIKDVREF